MAPTHCISVYVLWHFRGPQIIVISKTFLTHAPHLWEPIFDSLGKHHSVENACHTYVFLLYKWWCSSDSLFYVGGQISSLRKIFSSVGYLRKCLDPLGGKKLNPSKNEPRLAEEETLHLSCGFALGFRLQGVQMLEGWEVAPESCQAGHWEGCLSWSRYYLEIRNNVWWAKLIFHVILCLYTLAMSVT